MGTTSVRDSILLVGASGRTGRYVLRYLCNASVPVIACVRSADRLASEPSLARAEVAFANVEQPHTLAPLIERAAHVIYLAGGNRRGLSPGAWQLEVDALSGCLELAKRSGLPGRWISVGYSGSDQRTGATTWAETRWRDLKLAADEVIAASGVNYFVLRTGRGRRLAAPARCHLLALPKGSQRERRRTALLRAGEVRDFSVYSCERRVMRLHGWGVVTKPVIRARGIANEQGEK